MGFAQGILDRRRGKPAAVERRAEWGSSAIPGPLAMGSGGSFANVNLAGLESNLQQVAIWSAIDLIASVAAQLPLDTFKKVSDKQSRNIGNPRVIEDPAGDGQGSEDWVYQYLVSKLGRGNAVGKQVIDPSTGYPTQTVLYHPDMVRAERDRLSGRARWWVDGREVDASDVWHRRSYPMPGCLLGMSPLRVHMTTVQLGISSTRFGAQLFTDGAIPSALLMNEEAEIDQTQATEVKARWMSAVWGTREPAVFGKGWKYQGISLNPDESQFLETNKYSQAQCARVYGPNVAEILGYETGGSMTYANVEQRSIDFLKFTLNRWLRDLEKTMTLWLPRGQFVKCNRKALLETDLLTRFKAYQIGIAGHFLAPSEARETEDLPPLTDEQREEIEAVGPQPKPPAEDGETDPASRHLPGKHDQSTHGRKKGSGLYAAGGDLLGSGKDEAVAVEIDTVAKAKSYPGGNGSMRKGPDGDEQMVSIAGRQGFDGKPKSVSKSEMDTLVGEKGHLELHRGVGGTANMTAAQVHAKYRGGDYYGGFGTFGNGTYAGPNRQRSADFYSDGTKGSMLRMAARPEAKVVNHRDLVREHEAYMAKQPKGSAQYLVFSDPGRYAAAKGYDIIHVQRGASTDEYVILNRTSVIVQKA